MYGHTLSKQAQSDALTAAWHMTYAWPFELIFRTFEWLITTEHLIGVPDSETDPWLQDPNPWNQDPTDALIDRLDRELKTAGYEEAKYGPLNGAPRETISREMDRCPCGYRTECHIHCGTGECHHVMQQVSGATESLEMLNACHPAVQEQRGDYMITYPGTEIIITPHPEMIIPMKPGVRYDAHDQLRGS